MLNKRKLKKLNKLYTIGKELTIKYLDILWDLETGIFAGKDLYDRVQYNITARFKQTCCKKAIDIKNSIKKKVKKRETVIEILEKENEKLVNSKLKKGKLKRRKQITINKNNIIRLKKTIKKIDKKPTITRFSLDLSGNHIKIQQNSVNTTLYKNWINLSHTTFYNIKIPFLRTKPFNKWSKTGKLSNYISVNKNGLIKVSFTINKEVKKEGNVIGCDIGLNNVYSFSNKVTSHPNSQNFDLPVIHARICKTKPNSVGCRKARNFRDNYIRESINQVDFSNIKILVLEDIKYLRYKKRTCRYLKSWRYALIFNKLKTSCEEAGVRIVKVDPCNTSRRCFKCGWVSINNRDIKNAKRFKCCKCKYQTDADINAAKNIKYMFFCKKKKIKNRTNITNFYFK